MVSDIVIVSKDLLDITAITNSVYRKYRVTKHRDLIKTRDHLRRGGATCVVVIGYPLAAMTAQEHHDFMHQVESIKTDFKHVVKCVIYGPHDRMQEEVKNNRDVACIARSIFFHDPAKWIE